MTKVMKLLKKIIAKVKADSEADVNQEGKMKFFRTHMWDLARAVKSHFPDYDPEGIWSLINEIVYENYGGWTWEVRRSVSGEYEAERMADISDEDHQADFINSWEKCSPAEDLIHAAMEAADVSPCNINDGHNSEGYRRFFSTVVHMSIMLKRKELELSQRYLAKIMGVRPNTINLWIRWARRDRLLKRIRKHSYNPKQPRSNHAAKYRVANSLRKQMVP